MIFGISGTGAGHSSLPTGGPYLSRIWGLPGIGGGGPSYDDVNNGLFAGMWFGMYGLEFM